jgi:hypothetical protein
LILGASAHSDVRDTCNEKIAKTPSVYTRMCYEVRTKKDVYDLLRERRGIPERRKDEFERLTDKFEVRSALRILNFNLILEHS